jgi:hypothetical protein
VEAVGVGVVTVKPGDRVYIARSVSGTYADYALALKSQAPPLPELAPSTAQGNAWPGDSSNGYRAGALDCMVILTEETMNREYGIEIDFEGFEAEARSCAEANPVAVLATGRGNRITARSMSILRDGLDAWFQTFADSEKYTQMAGNASVALCFGGIQLEGKAELRGTATDPGNEWFLEHYPALHPGSFTRYGRLSGERVVIVRPERIAVWKYIEGNPYIDRLDIAARKAWRETVETARL